MIWVISFLALVASTLGCGVRPVRVYNPDYAAMLAKRSVSLAEDLPKRLPRRLPKYLLDELSEDLSEELPEKLPEELPSVIGGRPVDIDHVWPWQVSIQTSTGQLECGGTLISQIWILTAAHCLVQPGKYIVVLGQYDRFKNENSQVMEIAKFITHPKHNKQTEHNNDIALLKLSSPVQMTSFISPICLHSFTSIPSGMLTRCVTTGWGKTETVLNPQFLQEATVPIVNQTQCRRVWG
ncbi:hypothetical protein Q8A67_018038 [Cirrhinus molitorella]|uniref:chymotrypsin n=1 Tax=Cirrhinus molitorella TaxID=172907 RepID=A0AA88TQD1_9TELE|nr:hypothetical protein Q8A67_018038 [Cirrhinus molitorella]